MARFGNDRIGSIRRGKAGLEGSGVARSDPARLGKARQAWFGGAALGTEWSVKAG